MSETVWIWTVVIICTTVILVAVFALPQLRSVLKVFKMRANKQGVTATIETKSDPNVMTDGNTLVGKDNKIKATGRDVSVRENTMVGVGNQIEVKSSQPRTKKK